MATLAPVASATEIDAVVAYSSELNRCFLLPIAEVAGMRGVHLRLDAPKNNQAQRIKWAADYELESMIENLRSPPTAPSGQWLNCGCRFPGL